MGDERADFVCATPPFDLLVEVVGAGRFAVTDLGAFHRGVPRAFSFFNRPGLLCHLANTTIWLDDVERAARLEPLLAPYAGELLVAGQACLVYDSADSLRGALLSMLGRHDEAVASGEAAARLCERANCEPTRVKNGHQLAASLAKRGAPGDNERARALANDTLACATSLGLEPDIRFAQAVLEPLT